MKGNIKLIHGLYFVFVCVFFLGSLENITLYPLIAKLAVEVSIFTLVLIAFMNRSFVFAPGGIYILLYVALTIGAGFVAGDSILDSLKYSRFVIYAYVIVCCVWGNGLSHADVKKLNTLILGLVALQIFASFYKMFVMGGRWENMVGTVFLSGGGGATSFSMFAMALFFSFYLYKHNTWLLLLTITSPVIGFASEKRAIFYYIPIIVLAVFIMYKIRESLRERTSNVFSFIFVFCAILLFFSYGIENTTRIRDVEARSKTEWVAGILSFGWSYSFEEREGLSTGRISSTQKVMQAAHQKDIEHLFFGWGPKSTVGKGGSFEELDIIYGITGWMRDIVSVGWPGATILLFFFFHWWRRLRRFRDVEVTSYWRALSLGVSGCFLVFFLIHFTYDSIFTATGVLLFSLMYFTAVLVSPYYWQERNVPSDENGLISSGHNDNIIEYEQGSPENDFK